MVGGAESGCSNREQRKTCEGGTSHPIQHYKLRFLEATSLLVWLSSRGGDNTKYTITGSPYHGVRLLLYFPYGSNLHYLVEAYSYFPYPEATGIIPTSATLLYL